MESPRLDPQYSIKKFDMVLHTYETSTWEMGAGGPEIQGHFQVPSVKPV